MLEERGGKTRLISRNRFRLPSLIARLAMIPMEPASLVMERRMLRGIKQRAERLAVTRKEEAGVETGKSFTDNDARVIGEEIGINWDTAPFDVEQFRIGMNVELEHGLHDPRTNVSNDDPDITAKVALAHLNEFPDYYTRLERMEEEAKRDWARGTNH